MVLKEKNIRKFTISFPVLKLGERYKIISENVIIEGTLRTISNELLALILKEIANGLNTLNNEGLEVNFFR